MKIFQKIRKRVDKAVSKMLKKAKKAGRKLMRKLGIGKGDKKKKQKGDKDERTDKEMQADLKKGIQEATAFVKEGGHNKKEIKKKLDQLERKYDLVELKLVIDKHNLKGQDKFHISGKVNPDLEGPITEGDLDEGDVNSEITRWKNKSEKTIEATDKILEKHEGFEGRDEFERRQNDVKEKWRINKDEVVKIGSDKELEGMIIDEFKEIHKESDQLLKDIKKAAPSAEKESSSNLFARMQPYRDDVWTKGPHVDIVYKDNPKLKVTEGLLELAGENLVWIKFGDMGKAKQKDIDSAQRIINKLHENSSIMSQAKEQVKNVLKNIEQALMDPSISKEKRGQAERGKEKFEKMMKKL